MEDASGLITKHATDVLLDGRAETLGDWWIIQKYFDRLPSEPVLMGWNLKGKLKDKLDKVS